MVDEALSSNPSAATKKRKKKRNPSQKQNKAKPSPISPSTF
jgi:hypothetical protein